MTNPEIKWGPPQLVGGSRQNLLLPWEKPLSSGGDPRKVRVACFSRLNFPKRMCVYRTALMVLRAGGCCCPLLPPLP